MQSPVDLFYHPFTLDSASKISQLTNSIQQDIKKVKFDSSYQESRNQLKITYLKFLQKMQLITQKPVSEKMLLNTFSFLYFQLNQHDKAKITSIKNHFNQKDFQISMKQFKIDWKQNLRQFFETPNFKDQDDLLLRFTKCYFNIIKQVENSQNLCLLSSQVFFDVVQQLSETKDYTNLQQDFLYPSFKNLLKAFEVCTKRNIILNECSLVLDQSIMLYRTSNQLQTQKLIQNQELKNFSQLLQQKMLNLSKIDIDPQIQQEDQIQNIQKISNFDLGPVLQLEDELIRFKQSLSKIQHINANKISKLFQQNFKQNLRKDMHILSQIYNILNYQMRCLAQSLKQTKQKPIKVDCLDSIRSFIETLTFKESKLRFSNLQLYLILGQKNILSEGRFQQLFSDKIQELIKTGKNLKNLSQAFIFLTKCVFQTLNSVVSDEFLKDQMKIHIKIYLKQKFFQCFANNENEIQNKNVQEQMVLQRLKNNSKFYIQGRKQKIQKY